MHVFWQVTLGKVLKVIVVMRSLFIDRTIVRGYSENVYTEDGKVSILESFVSFAFIFWVPEQTQQSPRWMTLNTSSHRWNDQQAWFISMKMNVLQKNISLSPLAFFIKLLLFPLSLMPLVEFLIYHLRPQLPH